MRGKLSVAVVSVLLLCAVFTAGVLLGRQVAAAPAPPTQGPSQMPDTLPPVARKPILSAMIEGTKNVQRIEGTEIRLAANQRVGVHLHPCPVAGLIVTGSIVFQIDGQPEHTLKPGDAFFEPANTRILRFDAGDEPATFVAFYLLGTNDHDLIKMIK
jgi:quercetin dioxygenase-like cupin family protein